MRIHQEYRSKELDDKTPTEFLRDAYGLVLSGRTLPYLAHVGRGPRDREGPSVSKEALENWVKCYFGEPGEYEMWGQSADSSDKVTVLFADKSGARTAKVRQQLETLGCRIEGKGEEIHSLLRAASTVALDAAVVHMDNNVEAALALIDILDEREIWTAVVTDLRELPASMSVRALDKYLCCWSFPADLLDRMDMSQSKRWLDAYAPDERRLVEKWGDDEFVDPEAKIHNQALIKNCKEGHTVRSFYKGVEWMAYDDEVEETSDLV